MDRFVRRAPRAADEPVPQQACSSTTVQPYADVEPRRQPRLSSVVASRLVAELAKPAVCISDEGHDDESDSDNKNNNSDDNENDAEESADPDVVLTDEDDNDNDSDVESSDEAGSGSDDDDDIQAKPAKRLSRDESRVAATVERLIRGRDGRWRFPPSPFASKPISELPNIRIDRADTARSSPCELLRQQILKWIARGKNSLVLNFKKSLVYFEWLCKQISQPPPNWPPLRPPPPPTDLPVLGPDDKHPRRPMWFADLKTPSGWWVSWNDVPAEIGRHPVCQPPLFRRTERNLAELRTFLGPAAAGIADAELETSMEKLDPPRWWWWCRYLGFLFARGTPLCVIPTIYGGRQEVDLCALYMMIVESGRFAQVCRRHWTTHIRRHISIYPPPMPRAPLPPTAANILKLRPGSASGSGAGGGSLAAPGVSSRQRDSRAQAAIEVVSWAGTERSEMETMQYMTIKDLDAIRNAIGRTIYPLHLYYFEHWDTGVMAFEDVPYDSSLMQQESGKGRVYNGTPVPLYPPLLSEFLEVAKGKPVKALPSVKSLRAIQVANGGARPSAASVAETTDPGLSAAARSMTIDQAVAEQTRLRVENKRLKSELYETHIAIRSLAEAIELTRRTLNIGSAADDDGVVIADDDDGDGDNDENDDATAGTDDHLPRNPVRSVSPRVSVFPTLPAAVVAETAPSPALAADGCHVPGDSAAHFQGSPAVSEPDSPPSSPGPLVKRTAALPQSFLSSRLAHACAFSGPDAAPRPMPPASLAASELPTARPPVESQKRVADFGVVFDSDSDEQ